MLEWILLAAAIGAGVIGIKLLARRSRAPIGWTAITDGKDYGARVEPSGSFNFPLAPGSIHYVTKACGPISGKALRMRYRIDLAAGARILGCGDGEPGTGPTLYFQRESDDWSGKGKYETYRWWATSLTPIGIEPGEHEVIALLSGRWTAEATSNSDDNPEAFRDALSHAARIGFTLGNREGYGHGVYATGAARFALFAFEVI